MQTSVLDLPPTAKNVPCAQLRVITTPYVDHMIESSLTASPSARCRTIGKHEIGTISEQQSNNHTHDVTTVAVVASATCTACSAVGTFLKRQYTLCSAKSDTFDFWS